MAHHSPTPQTSRDFLSLPPISRALDFLTIAQSQDSYPTPPKTVDTDKIESFRTHIRKLTIESQHAILGLPEALIGLEILTRTTVPKRAKDMAEELACWAFEGEFGNLNIANNPSEWFVEAVNICSMPSDGPALKLATATDTSAYFNAVHTLSEMFPSLKFYETHGFVFPNTDTLDCIFAALDKLARRAGGRRLLSWTETEANKESLLYNMIISYGAKYIRTRNLSNSAKARHKQEEALSRFKTIATSFFDLLRFQHHTGIGVQWTLPGLALEEMVRHILRTTLAGFKYRSPAVDVDFIDYILNHTGLTLPHWDEVKNYLQRPPGNRLDLGVDKKLRPALETWTHVNPQPCSDYGTCLQATFGNNLGRKPIILLTRGRATIAPRPTNTELVQEVQERLNLPTGQLGIIFEDYIADNLSQLGPVTRGDYRRKGNAEKTGDIDAIVRSSDGSVFVAFECKAASETPRDWSGGYHAVINYLQKGFFKSQEQLLRLERALLEADEIEVWKAGQPQRSQQPQILTRPQEILRVSVSMRDYGEIHKPGYAASVLSHLCAVNVVTSPSAAIATSVAETKAKAVDHITALEVAGVNRESILRRTIFVDMSLLTGIVRQARTADDLITMLTEKGKAPRTFTKVIYS